MLICCMLFEIGILLWELLVSDTPGKLSLKYLQLHHSITALRPFLPWDPASGSACWGAQQEYWGNFPGDLETKPGVRSRCIGEVLDLEFLEKIYKATNINHSSSKYIYIHVYCAYMYIYIYVLYICMYYIYICLYIYMLHSCGWECKRVVYWFMILWFYSCGHSCFKIQSKLINLSVFSFQTELYGGFSWWGLTDQMREPSQINSVRSRRVCLHWPPACQWYSFKRVIVIGYIFMYLCIYMHIYIYICMIYMYDFSKNTDVSWSWSFMHYSFWFCVVVDGTWNLYAHQKIPCWELTYPFPKACLKMIFLFPRWDMDSFPGG